MISIAKNAAKAPKSTVSSNMIGKNAGTVIKFVGFPCTISGKLTPIKKDLQTLLRLLRASGEGRYRQVSKKNLLLAAAGIAYLVSPLDVIPDFLPGGLADDAAVITFIVRKMRAELVAFEAWERGVVDI